MTAVIVCQSSNRCSFKPEAAMPSPRADRNSFTEVVELVLTLGLFWLVSAVHAWSAICVGASIANGTFGSVDSLVSLLISVLLPVFAHKGLSVWGDVGSIRSEGQTSAAHRHGKG